MRSASAHDGDPVASTSRSRFRRTLAAFGLLLGFAATSVAAAPGALAASCDQPAHSYVTRNGLAYSSGNFGGTEFGVQTITLGKSDVFGLGAAGVLPDGLLSWDFVQRDNNRWWWHWGTQAGGNCVANEFFTNVTLNGQHTDVPPGQYVLYSNYAWPTTSPGGGFVNAHPEVYINVV
jgi:hypothetical protein